MTDLLVLRAGALTTVQDRGRPGYAHLGVPRSGALDAAAHALANRLLGNPADAATLETTLDGVALRTSAPVTVAVTGAPCAVRASGRAVAWGAPVWLPAGAELEVGRAESGLRSYVAVRGGFGVPPVLGSRATDLLSGLGPAVLTAGAVLPVGRPGPDPVSGVDVLAVPGPPSELVLPVRLGPRADWFTPGSLAGLWRSGYRVSAMSNRIGLRTEAGPPLIRARGGELPSEGMVLGAVQVPPDGLPVVFLADHPVTGGYPVVGVIPPGPPLDAAAQARPGVAVRFVAA
ncbi:MULTISPECIES: biotin-dependent carboxyltransferase family protein [unclassified Streptomyces]|uniref:5-oxoprolinase subunit C family protein n=1 Tax=unclassified Streptomyces TaxID=2593676 RepID=UPI001BE56CB2|nr:MULTISPECIES: biotin-dependent carboxyltransferase family protein [unclassified Streptomyces]MBT2407308.1 biotin-dependent carboxyltransferase family protein [Streptomyces sp. ISL-21]MBT2459389.1 biotin-dependent carboxyltransferase family protein [Streptomyces sp. ISL-86]MBT2613395.1 biotin-dependent carboxyltransferase family protein [Streptomyces sp. ISL-87]